MRIHVNHHGWIMMGNDKTGYKFTTHPAGAKILTGSKEDQHSELYRACVYIENVMQCNYDIVW